jgi:hypothetical protein
MGLLPQAKTTSSVATASLIVNEASQYLLAIAKQISQTYTNHPQAKAAMVTGSVAEVLNAIASKKSALCN